MFTPNFPNGFVIYSLHNVTWQRNHLYLSYNFLLVIGKRPTQSRVRGKDVLTLIWEVLWAFKCWWLRSSNDITRNCFIFKSFPLLFSLISANWWQKWLLKCYYNWPGLSHVVSLVGESLNSNQTILNMFCIRKKGSVMKQNRKWFLL